MIARGYSRCVNDHYFMDSACPFDGWSSPASARLADTVRQLAAVGQQISLTALRSRGVPADELAQAIVVQFGPGTRAFDAVSAERYSYYDFSTSLVTDRSTVPAKAGPGWKIFARPYFRCNGGDYFLGLYCANDGWASSESKDLTEAVTDLVRTLGPSCLEDGSISFDRLAAQGVLEATLNHTLVIEFADKASIFGTLVPAEFIISGVRRSPYDV